MKRFLLTAAILLLALPAIAQNSEAVPFNGLIVDLAGKGIKNVKVEVKNDGRYTKTDKQGRFGLTNLGPQDTLVFTIKRRTHEVEVGDAKSLRIVMASENTDEWKASQDDELVDFGFMYVKRREFTGSASGLTEENLKGYTDLADAINALVPNVNVSSDGSVIIRGQRSLTANNNAMILLNNQEIGSVLDVNIYDVKSVEIIKDGVGYGSRGANGVVVIRTK
ncbi:MAG: TonB-dependent receptor plug domain-containing protein [Bacteroidales bacterium]|nr:TonB-dependent receptor plug domain-containing protein [Bacteroidales bacterium]MBO7479877.1 TonB-dependent receptor plug domain-containing protein [Bacteroidales bacterium]MBO7486922.1 TonB-dependent receptor plug domain-containing protein [Bacteroidales bacterium]